jgi:hypothetical protein
MLNTAVSILAALALLLPGFIIVELSLARGARSSKNDLELALRSIAYALVIHLVFSSWTADLVRRLGPVSAWDEHVDALAAYSAVVLVGVPVVLGGLANVAIARAERREGPPPLWAAALGAGEARDAFDFMWQRVSAEGAWVIVELVGHTSETPRLVGGLFGSGSAAGQTPAGHDLYLQQLCVVAEGADGLRRLVAATDPPRGLWIAADQISRIEILPESDATISA